jgi:hypothetical protein
MSQVTPFFNIVESLKVMSLTLHACSELKSFDYGAITIEFVNCLPTKLNGDILFAISLVRLLLGHYAQLQGMDKKYDGHPWCKLQTNNFKNSFGLRFRMKKCLGHLCYQNDYSFLFQCSSICNDIAWSGNCSWLQKYG